MSGKQEKRKRAQGQVISIAAKRAEREFERQVKAAMDRYVEDRALGKSRARTLIAVVLLAAALAACVAIVWSAFA